VDDLIRPKICVEVMQAPVELILRVLVSSINSEPDTSAALRNRAPASGYAASVGLKKSPPDALLENVEIQVLLSLSTNELVRIYASGMPEDTTR